jgi:hypothetical protein
MARENAARAPRHAVVNSIPALAAAMAAVLLHRARLEAPPPVRERDELRLWLVAAALALLVR